MPTVRVIATLLFVPALLIPTSPVWAADTPATQTSSLTVDADYGIQGEYFGAAWGEDGCWSNWGLQVVALGQGKFQAVEYRGGLPGYGWDGLTRRALKGEKSATGTQLAGENSLALLSSDACGRLQARLSTPSGHCRGYLARVERVSPTMGAQPPVCAEILFNGTAPEGLVGAKLTSDGLLQVGTNTKHNYDNFMMHLEFRTPYMPAARGQARGNSGVYIQGRYEVQILDSFGLEGVNNECGGLYKTRAPDLNMCLPPLVWQTYDLEFYAARFQGDQKICPARITVRHNGVPVHCQVEIPNKTGGGTVEGPNPLPIKLQDHGNPVHFRNIWIRRL